MSDKVYAVVCVDGMHAFLRNEPGAEDTSAILGPFATFDLAEQRIDEINTLRMCCGRHLVVEVGGA